MLSISLLLVAGTPAATVTGTACPSTYRGAPLSNSQVTDGPPEEMAILRGSDDRKVGGAIVSSWRVAYVYKQGRQVHLFCEYAKGSSLVIKVARSVGTCLHTAKGRRETIRCR